MIIPLYTKLLNRQLIYNLIIYEPKLKNSLHFISAMVNESHPGEISIYLIINLDTAIFKININITIVIHIYRIIDNIKNVAKSRIY